MKILLLVFGCIIGARFLCKLSWGTSLLIGLAVFVALVFILLGISDYYIGTHATFPELIYWLIYL